MGEMWNELLFNYPNRGNGISYIIAKSINKRSLRWTWSVAPIEANERIGTNLKNSSNVFLLDRKLTVEVRASADKKLKKLFLPKVQVSIWFVNKPFYAETVTSPSSLRRQSRKAIFSDKQVLFSPKSTSRRKVHLLPIHPEKPPITCSSVHKITQRVSLQP